MSPSLGGTRRSRTRDAGVHDQYPGDRHHDGSLSCPQLHRPDRPTRGAPSNGKASWVAGICSQAVAAAASQGARRSWVKDRKPDDLLNARKDTITSDAHRVAMARRNVDKAGLGGFQPGSRRELRRDQQDIVNRLNRSGAMSSQRRPASAGASFRRVGADEAVAVDRHLESVVNAHISELADQRLRRPASASAIMGSRCSIEPASQVASATEHVRRVTGADESTLSAQDIEAEGWHLVAQWKGGPFVPRLDDSMDTNYMLRQARATDAMSDYGEDRSESSSMITARIRPASAPLQRIPRWTRPKPISRENPQAARLRKGDIRLKLVPDNGAHIYMGSEYRRAFPRPDAMLPEMKVKPQTHAATAPCGGITPEMIFQQ